MVEQRLRLILRIADAAVDTALDDVRVIFRECGADVPYFGGPYGDESDRGRILESLSNSDDQAVMRLASFLEVDDGSADPGAASPWKPNHIRCFISHLSTSAERAKALADAMQREGIDGFVAHQSIQPTKEWQDVIEAGLASCDIMVVMLEPGILKSKWCDQEIGWVRGRRRPILTACFEGLLPHGFISATQAITITGEFSPNHLAETVAEAVRASPGIDSLRKRKARVNALVGAGNFARANSLIDEVVIDWAEELDDEDRSALATAAVRNSQIANANELSRLQAAIAPQPSPAVAVQNYNYDEEPF